MSLAGGSDPSGFEPLLPDERVFRIAEKIRSEFGHGKLEGADFVTFIQPARPVEVEREGVTVPTWIEEMVVFAVISDNPRSPGHRIMTHGTVSSRDFMEAEAEASHFVSGGGDPARDIFRIVVKNHLQTLDNLRDMN